MNKKVVKKLTVSALFLSLLITSVAFTFTSTKSFALPFGSWADAFIANNAVVDSNIDGTSLNVAMAGANNGIKVQSSKIGNLAKGSGVTFKPSLKGDFMLCYSIIPKQADGLDFSNAFTFRKLKFTFTDLDDATNKFDYVVHNYHPYGEKATNYATNQRWGGQSNGMFSYVEYNGIKRAYNFDEKKIETSEHRDEWVTYDALYGGAQKSAFYGVKAKPFNASDSGLNNQSSYFYWDSTTKQIIATSAGNTFFDYPIADLDDANYTWGKTFNGFENYQVSIAFEDIIDGEQPAIMISSPMKSYWNNDQRFDNSGAHDRDFTPYSVSLNNAVDMTNVISTTKFIDKNIVVKAGDYEDGYIVTKIGAANVEAKYGFNEESAIAITNETVFPQTGGNYKIFARVKDSANNFTNYAQAASFTIVANLPVINVDGTVDANLALNKAYSVPNATVTFNGVTTPVFDVFVTGPAGSKYNNTSIKTDLSFTPDKVGDFVVKYKGLETFTNSDNITPNPNEKEFTINVKEFSPDVFFDLGGASIEYGKNGNGNLPSAVKTGNGALISSKPSETQAITTVNFNMIFNDTFDLKYSFLHDKAWAAFNSVKFRFTDAVDANKYFDYNLQKSSSFNPNDRTSASVIYKDQTFATKYDDPNIIYTTGDNGSIQDACFYWEWYELIHKGSLKYSNTTKEVKGSYNGKDAVTERSEYVVASFNDNAKYPWINAFSGFTNGYKVSIIMDVAAKENGQILIHSINGVDLGGATLSETRGKSSIVVTGGDEEVAQNTVYTDKGAYGVFGLSGVTTFNLIDSALTGSSIDTSIIGAKTVTYSYADKTATRNVNVIALPVVTIGGEVGSTYKTGSAVEFPDCTSVFGTQNAATAFKMEITKKGEQAEDITSTKTYTFLTQGEYTLKYYGFDPTLLNDAQKVTNVVEKTINVYNFNAADLFALNGNTATPCANGSAVIPHPVNTGNGLGIDFNSEKEVKINAIFSGNFNFNYSFLHSGARDLDKFTVRFTDAKNSENFFDYVLVPDFENNYTLACVSYNGKQRSTSKDDADLVVKDTDILLKFDDPKNNYAGYQNAYFYWSWGAIAEQGDLNFELTTKSISASYRDYKYQIASLIDEKYDWGKTFSGFTEGYSVSFIPKFAAEKTSAKLLVHNINGIDFSKELLESFASNDTITVNGASETIDASSSAYTDKGAKYSFNLGAADVKFFTDITSSSVVNSAVVGVYPVEYNAFGKTATRTVTVSDLSAPIINLADGVQDNTNWYYGAAQAVIGAADVTAVDFVDGNMTNVVISIKKGSGEYAPFDSLNITNDISGTIYTIKYESTDKAGNKGEITRTITVIDLTDPVITVDENAIPNKAFIGAEITLPTATATDVGAATSLPVTVKVMLDGKAVDVLNNKFTTANNGIYIVTYTATDDGGNECVITKNVVVSDDYAPIITLIAENVAEVKRGTIVKLSAASAVDALGGAETNLVTVSVKFGTEEITVVDNIFTPNKVGEYIVSYSITDKYSKTATITNTITVTEPDSPIVTPPTEHDKGCNSASAVGILLAVLGMAIVAIKRH